MNYIIFDLEATCWEERNRKGNEIIEIGAVKVNAAGAIVGEFQSFVRPVKHPELSDFCQRLTTITQLDVDAAETFPTVSQRFRDWIGPDYLLCSWGYYDRRQLRADCKAAGLNREWVDPHISVKHQHGDLLGLERPLGMMGALELEGITPGGTHHRGIDDARNIASIFLRHFGKWEVPG